MFFWIIFIPLSLLSLELIIKHPILQRDDHLILDPLFKINSPLELFSHIFRSTTPDFQPLRDLCLWAESLLQRNVPISVFHLTNIALWSLAVTLVRNYLKPRCKHCDLLIIVWALHPAAFTSLAWISSQKHLLALVFILFATKTLLQNRNTTNAPFKTLSFFTMSLLSQPIYSLWPIFYHFREGSRSFCKNKILSALLWGLSLAVLSINYFRYRNYYEINNLVERATQLGSPRDLQSFVLALGRMWFQIFVPVDFATDYSQQSHYNFIGLLLGTGVMIGLYYLARVQSFMREYYLWIILKFIPVTFALLVVHEFWFDSYLLLPLLLFLVPLAYLLDGLKTITFAAFLPIGCFFIWQDLNIQNYYKNDLNLWQKTFDSQGTCTSALSYSVELLRANQREDFQKVAQYFLSNHCNAGKLTPSYFYLFLYWNQEIAIDRKIQLFEQGGSSKAYPSLLLSMILEKNNQRERALEMLRKILQQNPQILTLLDDIESIPIKDFLLDTCSMVKTPFCALLVDNFKPSP